MVNPDYEPTEAEERVLSVMREEWRANPLLIREKTGLGKGDINTALSNLRAAGWVRRVTRGLYEFVDDPREGDETDVPDSDPETDAIVAEWTPPGEVHSGRARRAVREAAAWLRDNDGPHKRSEFVEALAGDSELSERVWWERAVQPGLRELADAGLVEYREGYHDYRYVGENDE